METVTEQLIKDVKESGKLLVGLGGEWKRGKNPGLLEAYDHLHKLIGDSDFFIVTMATDGEIFQSKLDHTRITAPCGNDHWLQCSAACTKDIWEEGEIPDGSCPHCGKPLTANTLEAETYIEEGYLPQWNTYMSWLTTTLNRKLTVLELGVGFKLPSVIRWPFEKTVYFNKKSRMYRVNETFAQKTEEIRERMISVEENSVEFLRKL